MQLQNQRFKALFTDLDGTAIPMSPNAMPSQVVLQAIKEAHKHAIVSVATGRPLFLCSEILASLEIKYPCIVEGGSQIIDPETHTILWEQKLSPEMMRQIQDICHPYHFRDDSELEDDPNLGDLPFFKGSKYMMVILGLEHSEAESFVTQLKKLKTVNALMVHSWREGKWDLHISHIGASKRHALEVLLGMLKLEASEVIGVGDSHNDLPLFEAAGFKVAMGNAIEELKEKADFVAPTVGEDGLATVIENFILPSK